MKVAALQVGDMGNGDLIVLAGTSKGNLSRLRLAAPLAPGSDLSEVQVYQHNPTWHIIDRIIAAMPAKVQVPQCTADLSSDRRGGQIKCFGPQNSVEQASLPLFCSFHQADNVLPAFIQKGTCRCLDTNI